MIFQTVTKQITQFGQQNITVMVGLGSLYHCTPTPDALAYPATHQMRQDIVIFSTFSRAASLAIAIALAAPGVASEDVGSGAYLAGRHAVYASDFSSAARYYTLALAQDIDNASLMENVTLSQTALGQLKRALPVAMRMESLGIGSQIAHMVVVADLVVNEDYEALLARDPDSKSVGDLVDGLLSAWAQMGNGSVALALEEFDKVADQSGLSGFALYHKALALALVGDYEGAEAIFSNDDNLQGLLTRRGLVARAQVLSQLGRNDEAQEILAEGFGSRLDPSLSKLSDRLASGEQLPFEQVTSVRDGMAEVFYTIGAALNGEAADEYTLIYARVAGYLRPDHVEATLLSAQLLDSLGQYSLAVETYKQIPPTSSDHHAAELGRAEALRRAAKPDAAIEVLERLALDSPTLPLVHSSLGDLLRQQEDYARAIAAYDKALEYTEEGDGAQWFLLYARGISHERLGDWVKSEADFRKALELNPNQPQVLNYLGYSLVEKQEKLDEALEMIERAVAARPESGYIVDSLGWVLYRLGRYEEAVAPMQKAGELMPIDPVVNDHLGDVFWAVGRKLEAEFQWRRALSFIDPDDTDGEADPERIRRKIEVGLDQVLSEDGDDPLKVANDDG
jgi:tetratricopeptide (TPR) repeat protein